MSAALDLEPRQAAQPATSTSSTPFWFQVGEQWCSAFWHRPEEREEQIDTVAVLCPSLLLEQVRGSRHQRAVARMLAANGIPALRMAYQATDNSSGHASLDGDDTSLVPAWSKAVLRAIDIARHRSGCQRVVVIARSAGALIALAALRSDQLRRNVELVLWDPPVSGAHFLREVQLRNRLRVVDAPGASELYEDALASRVTVERAFVLNQDTVNDLRMLTLEGPAPRADHAYVVVPRAFRQVARALKSWLPEQHSVVMQPDASLDLDYWEGPQVPEQTMRAILGIVSRNVERSNQFSYADLVESRRDVTRTLIENWKGCSPSLELPMLGIREEWVNIPSTPSPLVGVLSTPRGAARMFDSGHGAPPREKVLLMFGTGVDPTPGEGDSNVLFARRVAALGIPVLRADFRGIGESVAQSMEQENIAYVDGRVNDVADCVRLARNLFPGAEVIAMAICSGAYWAIHAASAQVPIDEVIAANPQLYGPGALQDLNALQDFGGTLIAHAATSPAKWQRLLSGQYTPSAVGSAAFGAVRSTGRSLMPWRNRDTFANGMPRLKLDELFPAATRFHLVYGPNDLGYMHFCQHGRFRLWRLRNRRRLTMHVVPDTDHTFSSPVMRRRLEAVAFNILGI